MVSQAGTKAVCERGEMANPLPDRGNRRSFPRFAVDCPATVTVISGASVIHGQMADLSRGGCRLVMAERVSVGLLTRVEVRFSLRGMAFRIVGVTAGARTGKSFAVRFLDMPQRREDELAELLAEIESDPGGPAEPARVVLEPPVVKAADGPLTAGPFPTDGVVSSGEAAAVGVRDCSPGSAKTGKSVERRLHGRHAVDTRMSLTLVRGAITMQGCILNLSQGGCRLRTDERFQVGIYTRVEAEFYLHGLPFRLAGVSQAILDKNTIGVKFLDMSERKRGQLTELIAEIEEKLGMDRDGNLQEG